MHNIIHKTAVAAALSVAFPALAQQNPTLPAVVVTANGIPTRDSDATYASEVHDRAMIEASGAASLYDYLAQNTSLNVLPGFGNKNQPLLDMRGYGFEAGYQNLVVMVDGYRLNNIDQVGPYLGGIPLEAVESIEISKGSGSVLFGDGAMSGAIQIRTRARKGLGFSAMTGSFGAQDLNVTGGLSREFFDLSFGANNSKQAALSAPDPSGHRTGSDNRAENATLTFKPTTDLKLILGGSNAYIDTRYPNALSTAQFDADPAQSGGFNFLHQVYESSLMRAGAEYAFTENLKARYMHNAEDKRSQFSGSPAADSNYDSDDFSLSYRSASFDVTTGVQRFDGERYTAPSAFTIENRTTKENTGFYLQGVYRIDALALSAGARREKVEYAYAPIAGADLNGDHKLNAWDLGANYRFSDRWSAFANLNQAFQAPDIDRFFTPFGTFNGFIEPAKSKNLTVGANLDTSAHRVRVTTFYSKLTNEIYLDPLTFVNTNIDKSHKYGLEISDRWQAFAKLSLSAAYTYTRSVVDSEDLAAGPVDNKELPGVPRHGLNLGASYQAWEGGAVNLTHAWRDSAYSISNFQNDKGFRQSTYNSTNLSLRQRWQKIEGFVGIDNLFDQKNGLWVYSAFANSNNVYPVDFRRTVRVGIKADLL